MVMPAQSLRLSDLPAWLQVPDARDRHSHRAASGAKKEVADCGRKLFAVLSHAVILVLAW
jgi:hypothetical protein